MGMCHYALVLVRLEVLVWWGGCVVVVAVCRSLDLLLCAMQAVSQPQFCVASLTPLDVLVHFHHAEQHGVAARRLCV